MVDQMKNLQWSGVSSWVVWIKDFTTENMLHSKASAYQYEQDRREFILKNMEGWGKLLMNHLRFYFIIRAKQCSMLINK